MGNTVVDYMTSWLNATYGYLKETGGPTYPPAATVGPNVLPSGAYTDVGDLKEDWYDFPAVSGTPMPFNPGSMGLPAIPSNQNDAIVEETKQASIPIVFSDGFAKIYGGLMSACIDDQKHRFCNPNANRACQDFAETGIVSKMIFDQRQKGALGMQIPSSQENDKSDEVRKTENAASLTGQISRGATDVWSGFSSFLGSGGIRKDISAGIPLPESPKGVNFQDLNEKLAGFIPALPKVPEINSGTLTMIAGGVILLMLVVLVIK